MAAGPTSLPTATPWQAAPRHPHASLGAAGLAGGALIGAAAAFGPAVAALALLACVGAAAVLARPAIGLLVVAAVVPVVSGLQRGMPLPGLRLSEALGFAISALILLRVDGRMAPPWRAFDWAALAYAVGTLVLGAADTMARGDPISTGALGTLFGPFQFLLLYRAALTVLHNEDRRAMVLRALLLASTVVSVLALLQRFELFGVGGLMTQLTGVDATQEAAQEAAAFGRVESLVRATGPFPHWQVLAGYLFVIAVLAASLALEPKQRVLPRPWLVVVAALAVGGMVASGTFTTTIGFIVALLMLGVWARRLAGVVAVMSAGAAVTTLAFWTTISTRVSQQFNGEPTLLPQSVDYRVELWQTQILPLLHGRWMTGYGPQLPPGVFFPYTESVYLTLLLRGGIVLLVLYGLLMFAIAAGVRRDVHDEDPIRRSVARTVLALVALLVPFHFLEPYFLVTGLPHVVWLLAAVALATGASARARA